MPGPLEKTWYTDVDYTGFADTSSLNNWCASMLWAIKQAMLGNVLNTNQPSGARWTTYYSCDGTTAGTAGDTVDRWGTTFDATKIKNVSTTRSWYVFKSPTGVNAYGPFYLMLSWGTGSSYQCNWFVSKTAPTGGSITADPTSTDSSSLLSQNWIDQTVPTAMKLSRTSDANGNFFLAWAKTGTGRPTHSLAFLTVADGPVGDVWPCFAMLDGANGDYVWLANIGSRNNHGTAGTGRTRNYNNTQSGGCAALLPSFSNGTVLSFPAGTPGTVDPADGKYIDFPSWWIQGVTTVQWKGRLQDFWITGGVPQNTTFTRDGIVTHVLFGAHWIPFNIQPSW